MTVAVFMSCISHFLSSFLHGLDKLLSLLSSNFSFQCLLGLVLLSILQVCTAHSCKNMFFGTPTFSLSLKVRTQCVSRCASFDKCVRMQQLFPVRVCQHVWADESPGCVTPCYLWPPVFTHSVCLDFACSVVGDDICYKYVDSSVTSVCCS